MHICFKQHMFFVKNYWVEKNKFYEIAVIHYAFFLCMQNENQRNLNQKNRTISRKVV